MTRLGRAVRRWGVALLAVALLPPGGPGPVGADDVGGQLTGSVLVYNLYTSAVGSPASQNTRLSVTNTSASDPASVHLFFVDGSNGSVADAFLCLLPRQTASFLASDVDPGVTGYVLAVATDADGCPIRQNVLGGKADVWLASGHRGVLAAVAVPALDAAPAACPGASTSLAFDGAKYARLPGRLALDRVASPADDQQTLLVVNRMGGDATTGLSALGTLDGTLYSQAGGDFPWTESGLPAQLVRQLSDLFPATAPVLSQVIPAGKVGWTRLEPDAGGAVLGAAFNLRPGPPGTLPRELGAVNLRGLTSVSESLVVPVFPSSCP